MMLKFSLMKIKCTSILLRKNVKSCETTTKAKSSKIVNTTEFFTLVVF